MSAESVFGRHCPVCDWNKGENLYTQESPFFDGFDIPKKRDIVSCGKCGFHFADAGYTDENLASYYQKYFTVVRVTEGETQTRSQAIHYANVVRKIHPFVSENRSEADVRICDIGCGRGAFLKAFAEQGFARLTGVDYCDLSDEELAQFEFDYICSDINSLQLPEKQDLIVSSHVFEHLLKIKPSIDSVYANLKPGGLAYIEVPDFEEFHSEDTRINTGIIEHTNRFTHYQLAKVVTDAGFRVRDMFVLAIGEDCAALHCLGVIAEKADTPSDVGPKEPGYSNSALATAQNFNFRVDWELAEFVGTQRPVYVWGVTYYTFEIMARTLLRKCHVPAMIDRSPIRQQHTVNGMKISSPELIKNAPDDSAVALCMASGAEKLAKELRDTGYKGKIVRFPYHPDLPVLLEAP